MKQNVLLAVVLFAGSALAQVPASKPAAEAPKPAAAAPAPAATPAPAAAATPVADAPRPVRKSRRNEDARKCLDEPNNNAIIKCAEAYL